MAEHGFTPGKWRAEKWSPVEGQVVALREGKRHLICAGVMKDDARLIAASPTLLEALEELEQRADEVVAALDKYNAENGTHLGGPPFFKIGVALAKARAAIALATGKDA